MLSLSATGMMGGEQVNRPNSKPLPPQLDMNLPPLPTPQTYRYHSPQPTIYPNPLETQQLAETAADWSTRNYVNRDPIHATHPFPPSHQNPAAPDMIATDEQYYNVQENYTAQVAAAHLHSLLQQSTWLHERLNRHEPSISPALTATHPRTNSQSSTPKSQFRSDFTSMETQKTIRSNGEESIPSPESLGDQAGFNLPDPHYSEGGLSHSKDPFAHQQQVQELDLAVPLPTLYENLSHEPLHSGVEKEPQDPEPSGFAMLQFADGSFVVNTYVVEFGRDVRGMEDAKKELRKRALLQQSKQKERESAYVTQNPASVISDGAGIMGVDRSPSEEMEDEVREDALQKFGSGDNHESESSVVVNPRDLQIERPLLDYNYTGAADHQAQLSRSYQQIIPEEIDGDSSQPDPNRTVLVPIHTRCTDAEEVIRDQKQISQRHIKIYWDTSKGKWKLQVLGRNGAFFLYPDESVAETYLPPWKKLVPKGSNQDEGGTIDQRIERLNMAKVDELEGPDEAAMRSEDSNPIIMNGVEYVWEYTGPYDLPHGQKLQVQGVQMQFKLPSAAQNEASTDESDFEDDDVDADENLELHLHRSTTSASVNAATARQSHSGAKTASKTTLATDGLNQPPVKRGPGRPPKDGVSSQREKRLEKLRLKMAAEKEANGGVTPPPSGRTQTNKPQKRKLADTTAEPIRTKRPYNKKQKPDEPDVIPSIEAGDEAPAAKRNPPKKGTKKQKSPAVQWPPKSAFTAEQLQDPPSIYSVWLHQMMMEFYPKQLTLQRVYHEAMKRYPCLIYKETSGWQSSIRHNLGAQNSGFEKTDKDGKGWLWKARPEWVHQKTKDKKQTQQTSNAARNGPAPRQPGTQGQVHTGSMLQFQGQPSQQFPYPSGQSQPALNMTMSQNTGLPNGPVVVMAPTHNLGGFQAQPSQPAFQPGVMNAPPPHAPPLSQTATANPSTHSVSSQQFSQNAMALQQQAAQTPSTSSLPHNMPCTMEGVLAVQNFRNILIGDTDSKEFVQKVFQSAVLREMHGATESLFGDRTESVAFEETIMQGIKDIIRKFPNPSFKGFLPRPAAVKQGNSSAASATLTTEGQDNDQVLSGSPIQEAREAPEEQRDKDNQEDADVEMEAEVDQEHAEEEDDDDGAEEYEDDGEEGQEAGEAEEAEEGDDDEFDPDWGIVG